MLRPRILGVASLALALAPLPVVSALTLTQTSAPTLGVLVSGPSGRQFVLNTDDTVGGSHAADYVSGAMAGRFVIEDTSSPSTLNISAIVLGSTGGLAINEVLCSYNGGVQQPCSGSGMSVISSGTASLRLGLDFTTSTVHRGGDSASATLELTVSYL